MTLDELATRLHAKRAGRGYSARCPAHEDASPSLSLNPARNGGIVLHCHAGCSPTDVCRALGITLADLQPDGPDGHGPHENGGNGANGKPTIAAIYDYTDAAGSLLFQVVRFQPKAFRQRRPDGTGGWTWNLGDTERPLYRLPAIVAAVLTGEPVYVVEGEKDVATLETWGLTATTCPGGAGKWRPEHTAALADAHVILIPDADSPGQRHAEAVVAALRGTVTSLRTLTLPAPAKDVTEWATGYQGSREALERLLQQAPPPAEPPPDTRFRPGDSPVERCTDMGNARRFARLYGHQTRHCWPTGVWYTYGNGVWSPDTTGEVQALAKDTVQAIYADAAACTSDDIRAALARWAAKSEGSARINALLDLARSEANIPVLPDHLDSNPDLLNLRNGTLEIGTATLRSHRASDLLTRQLPYDYDPTATCPRWRQFLDRAMDNQQDMVRFIQRAVGYSLTGLQTEQCFFFLYGAGANGKSVFLNALQALFGPAGHVADFSTFLKSRENAAGRARGDVARLAGARLVTSTEAGDGQRFDEEFLKKITGGERVTARQLYQDEIEFTPQFTLWLAANHRPTIRGADLGIWRRVCLVPFAVTIPEEERDGRLLLKGDDNPLIRERPGILNWALEGYRAWRSEGLNKPAVVILATETYREDSDVLGRFIEEECARSEHGRATAAALYAAYKSWAERNGEGALPRERFGGGLVDRGFQRVKSHGVSTYHGLSLLSGERGSEIGKSRI